MRLALDGGDVRRTIRLIAPPVLATLVLIGAWQLLSASGLVRARLLPPPGKVA